MFQSASPGGPCRQTAGGPGLAFWCSKLDHDPPWRPGCLPEPLGSSPARKNGACRPQETAQSSEPERPGGPHRSCGWEGVKASTHEGLNQCLTSDTPCSALGAPNSQHPGKRSRDTTSAASVFPLPHTSPPTLSSRQGEPTTLPRHFMPPPPSCLLFVLFLLPRIWSGSPTPLSSLEVTSSRKPSLIPPGWNHLCALTAPTSSFAKPPQRSPDDCSLFHYVLVPHLLSFSFMALPSSP